MIRIARNGSTPSMLWVTLRSYVLDTPGDVMTSSRAIVLFRKPT